MPAVEDVSRTSVAGTFNN